MKKISLCFAGFIVGGMFSQIFLQKRFEVKDPKVYFPQKPKRKFSLNPFISRGRRPILAYEKSNLRILGQIYAMHYSDGHDNQYVNNPQDLNLDLSLFKPSFLQDKYISLPNDWKVPDNWHEFNQSNSPYVFVGGLEGEYTGAADKPLFIVKNGYQAVPDLYNAVYEDGHVARVPCKEAIKLWKRAGVWNLSE